MRERTSYAVAAALLCGLLAAPGGAAAATGPASSQVRPTSSATGWATASAGTTGGAGAAPDSVHVVRNRAELKAALANHGAPTAPKVITVRGAIHGNQTDDGRLLDAQDYAPGASPDIVLANFHGHQFADTGSWYRGRSFDMDALARRKFEMAAAKARADAEASGTEPPEWATRTFTTDVGWSPSDVYRYRPLRSAAAVKRTVLREAGPTLSTDPHPRKSSSG